MNSQQPNPARRIVAQLYNIRNIANLATYCPEKYVDVDVLQDVFEHISCMTQSLIEELEQ